MRNALILMAGGIVLILLLFPFIVILFRRIQLHDSKIPKKESLVESTSRLWIMPFFPHPDDEVTVSGTLLKLIDQGHEVQLICLLKKY